MSDSWGKPDIPPAKKNPGTVLTRFNGFVDSVASTPKGMYKMVVVVGKEEWWKAMLASDRNGIMLHFVVYAPDEGEVMREMDEAIMAALSEGVGDDAV